MNKMIRSFLMLFILIGSAATVAAATYLAAPETDSSSYWACYNATKNGVTYGVPVDLNLCFAGYKVESDHRGNLNCYRRDAKGNAYGPYLPDQYCN